MAKTKSEPKVIGQYAVGPVTDADGNTFTFLPGRECPQWAVELIDNPYAFEDGEPGQETNPAAPPPQNGRGSGRDAWSDYAFQHGVSFDGDAPREEIIEACRRAGVNVQ